MNAPAAPTVCPRCGRPGLRAGGFCADCLLALAAGPAPKEAGADDPWWDALGEDSAPRLGRYELLEEIARGGMGVVYRARQRGAGRIVALKSILPQQLASAEMVARFRAEAEAVASLDHEAILPIYEVGEQDGLPFFSMKLAEGGSLAAQAKPLEPRAAASLVAKVARAVQHAHERGILHRDLKPGNILLDAAGQPFVSDFGLAKWLDQNSSMTRSRAVLGTPSYIAPEQAAGEATLTTAADVYSLGVILYELLAGRAPFVGASVMDVLRQVAQEPAPGLRELRPGLPADLEVICLKCLQKVPADRYRSAAALAEDLESWLEGRPIAARPQTRGERLLRWARRNRALAVLSTVVLALLLAVAIGSSVAVVRLRGARADTLEQLRSAALAEARATRLTGRIGQRFDALAAVERAARIRPGLDARDAAIAASALSDVRVARRWSRHASTANPTVFDARLERYTIELPDGSIAVCATADQRELFRLPGPEGGALETVFAFSPTGEFLVAKFRGGETRVWRLADRRLLVRLTGNPTFGLGWCALSGPTRLLAFGRPDGSVEVHRLDDLAAAENALDPPPWRRFPDSGRAQGLAFDPRGERLAICDVADGDLDPVIRKRQGRVLVREVESGRTVCEYPLPEGAACAHWSDDGSLLAITGWDRNVHLVESATGRRLRLLRGHRDATVEARFNHAGTRVLSVGFDATMRLWDAGTGEPLLRWSSTEIGFAYGPDDRQVGLVLDRATIGLLDVEDSTTFRAWRTEVPSGRPLSLVVSPDGALVASTGFTGTQVWDAASGRAVLRQGTAEVRSPSVAFARLVGQWQLLAGDPVDGYRQRALPHNPGSALGEARAWWTERDWLLRAVSPDGLRAFLSRRGGDGSLLCEVSNPAMRTELPARVGRGVVVFSADGALVAAGSSEEAGVSVWDARSGRKLAQLDEGVGAHPAFDPKGRWLVTGTRAGYRFWARSDWRAGPRIEPEVASSVFDDWAAAFSPDGRLFACTQAGDRLSLHAAASGELLAHLEPPFPLGAQFLAFSPDSRWLFALGSDQTVQRWDVVEIQALLRRLGLDW